MLVNKLMWLLSCIYQVPFGGDEDLLIKKCAIENDKLYIKFVNIALMCTMCICH